MDIDEKKEIKAKIQEWILNDMVKTGHPYTVPLSPSNYIRDNYKAIFEFCDGRKLTPEECEKYEAIIDKYKLLEELEK